MCEAWAGGGPELVKLLAEDMPLTEGIEVLKGLVDAEQGVLTSGILDEIRRRLAEVPRDDYYWLPVPWPLFLRVQKLKARGSYRPRRRRMPGHYRRARR